MGLVYDPRVLLGVTIVRPRVVGVLQMVSEPTLAYFTSAYGSVEKDMISYGLEMWVCMYDARVL
jgi:hypothetical protein